MTLTALGGALLFMELTAGAGILFADSATATALSFSCSRIAFSNLALSLPLTAGGPEPVPAVPFIIPRNAVERSMLAVEFRCSFDNGVHACSAEKINVIVLLKMT